MVRNADSVWKETKKLLHKDSRWELVESLPREEREKLFDEHVEVLLQKNRSQFHKLLEESEISLTSRWKEVKKLIKDDPRYSKYSSSDRVKLSYDNVMKSITTFYTSISL